MDRILIILKKENGPTEVTKYHNIQICLLVYEADLRCAFTGPLVLWFFFSLFHQENMSMKMCTL